MANPINPYMIKEGGLLKITNTKKPSEVDHITYRESITRGVDGKIETPDAGRITKFGPVKGNLDDGEYIVIPEDYAAIKLPLYRAGAGTTVTCLPQYFTKDEGAETYTLHARTILITPTLSEEVVYYFAACKELGLECKYEDAE